MEKEFHKSIDSLCFSSEAKDRLCKKIQSDAKGSERENITMKKWTLPKVAAAAAAVLALSGGGVYAAGVITGRAYYNEVHIGDLIVGESHRGRGLGSRLVRTVEEAFRGKGYDVLTLTTFGFQAPEFYRKLGFTTEFIRGNRDPKLSKYFLRKDL